MSGANPSVLSPAGMCRFEQTGPCAICKLLRHKGAELRITGVRGEPIRDL